MKITAHDIARLRWSLALVAATLVVGTGAVLATQTFVRKAQLTNGQLAAQVNDIRSRLSRARDEERDILDRIARYQDLAARGVIGPEARLDWVEEIARLKRERRLLDLRYDLQAQGPISPEALPGGATAGAHEIMASTMKLDMQLLHEDDLLGFLDDLRKHVNAHLLVRECRIARATHTSGEQGLPAQLQAECLIDWITLREKK